MLNRAVLVLNQSYEPVHVCTVRRAIILVFRGRAEVIESLDTCIRSVSAQFPVPSVVRLAIYVRIAPKKLSLSKRNILKRDGHQCQYCGGKRGPMTVDHVVPRTIGGRDSWENLVCACLVCNNRKGNQTPERAGISLIRKPRQPNHVTFISRFVGVPDQRWRPYLFMD
ncbi:MAG: HNH endonuclease [Candidatus Latescibacteria bacterium]|nr:HNH endonuclease [Candidatus Latescibacterota bacterium]